MATTRSGARVSCAAAPTASSVAPASAMPSDNPARGRADCADTRVTNREVAAGSMRASLEKVRTETHYCRATRDATQTALKMSREDDQMIGIVLGVDAERHNALAFELVELAVHEHDVPAAVVDVRAVRAVVLEKISPRD